MTSKTAHATTTTTELTARYHHASHVAHTLLASHEKHDDLPLVVHAHACLVLGCSDEDDCYERMEEALVLIKLAVEEGVVRAEEGEAMVKSCEVVMGMRGQKLAGSDGSDDEGSEKDGEDEDDGVGEGDKLSVSESKDEGADDGEGYEKNDALP